MFPNSAPEPTASGAQARGPAAASIREFHVQIRHVMNKHDNLSGLRINLLKQLVLVLDEATETGRRWDTFIVRHSDDAGSEVTRQAIELRTEVAEARRVLRLCALLISDPDLVSFIGGKPVRLDEHDRQLYLDGDTPNLTDELELVRSRLQEIERQRALRELKK